MDNLGVSFAPTTDNAAMGPKNGSLAGVPQAIQVISMQLPRLLGARPVAPGSLLGSQGGGGNPVVQSALLQTILKSLGLPGGTAGPGPVQPTPNERGPELPSPFTPMSDPAFTPPSAGSSQPAIPNIVFGPTVSGANPGGPVDRRPPPFTSPGRGGRGFQG
jgi:hypothetical protein